MEQNKHIADLEYLSERGFNAMPEAIGDIKTLEKRIQKRARRPFYKTWAVVTIGLGLLLCAIWLIPIAQPTQTVKKEITATVPQTHQPIELTLDSIEIIGEKFIRHQTHAQTQPINNLDTLGILLMSPQLASPPNNDAQLQTSRVEQVIYIRELKIVEYGLLYFNYHRELSTKGIPASSSGKSILLHDNETKLYDLLDEGLKYYREGDFAAAMVKFRVLLNYNGQDLNAQFYMGMCAYHRGWYTVASDYFNFALNALNPAFHEESAYYSALCLSYTDKTKAIEKMKQIANAKGFYQTRAADWLKAIDKGAL